MSLLFNLRQLEEKSLVLKGKLTAEELELTALDELIHFTSPLSYDLEAQKLEGSVLVQGTLLLTLDCECARCLKPFSRPLSLDPWVCHLPVEGEERIPMINDFIDLTPYIREDILLKLPQNPLCAPECNGLLSPRQHMERSDSKKPQSASSAWTELNKLKLE